MLKFYYRAIWEDIDGWKVTFSFWIDSVSRISAEAEARELAKWYGNKVPNYFRFQELILVMTETI